MKKIFSRFLKLVFILIIISIVYIAYALFSYEEEESIPYRTEKIVRGNIAHIITANGSITPQEVITVGAQVSGQITAIHVKLGDEVKTGQLLAEIDPALALNDLKRSKARLETSKIAYEQDVRNYNRTKTLAEKNYVAKVDLERAYQSLVSGKNSYESAITEVENDEVKLGYTKVTSPIDGVIIAQKISKGQTLASNFQAPDLFSIARDLSIMKIEMNIPEADVSKIAVDMPVDFSVDAYEDRTFTGKITEIGLNPNNASGVVTYTAVVVFDNQDRALRPGMTANIAITLSEIENVLRIPAAALRFSPPKESAGTVNLISNFVNGGNRPNKSSKPKINLRKGEQLVYLWENNDLKPVAVTVGKSDDLYFEATGRDIKEGATVVVGLIPILD